MVDSWEVEQRQYTRTLFVLQRVERALGEMFWAGQTPAPAEVRPWALPGWPVWLPWPGRLACLACLAWPAWPAYLACLLLA